ncbi:MAG: PDZ domain-containing protein [Candidatus Brocadiaceae bacterium]|jgi:serine protease DegS
MLSRSGRTAILVCAFVAALAARPASAETTPCDLGRALQRASESVVRVEGRLPLADTPMRMGGRDTMCVNTGFFVSEDGLVLTGLSGIVACKEILVTGADGRRGAAEVVAVDQAAGLAALRTPLRETVPLEFAERFPEPATIVVLASAPTDEGRTPHIEPGLIASREGSVRLQGYTWKNVLVAALKVPTGAAAAPLLDADGRLVAVVLAVRPAERVAGWVRGPDECFALPAGEVHSILARLRRGQSRRLGWLGLSILQEAGELEGVRVSGVLENSPAHEAGVRPGDVLLQIDEQPIESAEAFAHYVAELGPREGVRLRLLRGGEMDSVTVDVAARPLLICAGSRRGRDGKMVLRWPGSPEGVQKDVRQLIEENRGLRQRVRQLEERLAEREAGGS